MEKTYNTTLDTCQSILNEIRVFGNGLGKEVQKLGQTIDDKKRQDSRLRDDVAIMRKRMDDLVKATDRLPMVSDRDERKEARK